MLSPCQQKSFVFGSPQPSPANKYRLFLSFQMMLVQRCGLASLAFIMEGPTPSFTKLISFMANGEFYLIGKVAFMWANWQLLGH